MHACGAVSEMLQIENIYKDILPDSLHIHKHKIKICKQTIKDQFEIQ